jgi:tetratricopeptide (TPR) repeat protein
MRTTLAKCFLLFVLVVLLLFFVLPVEGQHTDMGKLPSFSGTLCDQNKHPLAGKEVILESATAGGKVFKATTDAQGHFAFDTLPAGRYRFRIKGEPYQTVNQDPWWIDIKEGNPVVWSPCGTGGPSIVQGDASASIPFSDEPQFTVAGVTDTTALGVHASSRAAPGSGALTKDTVALVHEEAKGSPSPDASTDLATVATIRAKLATGENADLRFQLAELEEKGNQPLEAVKDYQRAAELAPTEPHLFGWGAELLLHRAIEPAIGVFRQGHERHPRSVRMLLGLGASYYAQGSSDEAAESFLQASDLDPADPQPYLFLGRLLANENVTPAGWVERMRRFANLHSEDAMAHYLYGLALTKQGEPQFVIGAETQFEKAIETDPHLGGAYLQLGILLAERKQFAQAEAMLQKAVECMPFPDEAHYRLAEVYRRTGEAEKARQETVLYKQIEARKAEEAERERHEIQQFIYTLRGTNAPK